MANPNLPPTPDRAAQQLIIEDRFHAVWDAIQILQQSHQALYDTTQAVAALHLCDELGQRLTELERRFTALLVGIQAQGMVIPLDVRERKPLEEGS